MVKILYRVAASEKEKELAWLHNQKIFPAVQEVWDWTQITPLKLYRFGVIVGSEAALSIRLRHNIESQSEYKLSRQR